MPTLEVDKDFAGRQILGTREQQQDSYAFSIVEGESHQAKHLLVVVADGMGGHSGGREASLAATQGFIDGFFSAFLPEDESASSDNCPPLEPTKPKISECLRKGLADANDAVDSLVETDPEALQNAGTTLLAIDLQADVLSWISVGDSPLFLWRGGKLQRLNQDHSMRSVLAEKVQAGKMRYHDLDTHPERNVLLSALRGMEIEKIDSPDIPFPLQASDILLAASDGILTLSEKEISKILKRNHRKTANEIVKLLLEAVQEKALPKQDNTTVALMKV